MDFDDIEDDALNELMDHVAETQNNKICENQNKPEGKLPDPGPEHLEVLSKYFGHKTFRPLQWEIISAIIHDKRDVCAIMSTGYGKSLCFQYPSTFLGGITLVISPLIALMEDQVLSLKVANIPACLLGTAQKKQKEAVDNIFDQKYSLVYLTPEFCTGDYGSDILKRMADELSVTLIAIDEAHCISSWGHDFRYQYRKLGVLRDIFTNTPIIAVTATATTKVRQDIVKSLKLRNPLLVCSGFDRPNIYFEVKLRAGSDIFKNLISAMICGDTGWRFSGSTIIYCITRKDTEDIAFVLKSNGINCLPYHAGLSLSAREEAHELFVKDKINVIVATIAFGMGIDKPDIRNVVHYGCSSSVESYYQEVGRAGRDGQPSNCVTFYSQSDLQIHRRLISHYGGSANQKETGLKKIEEYLTTSECRRRFILKYFEENVDNLDKPRKSCCDICTKKLYDTRTDCEKYQGIDENGCYDFTNDAHTFLKAVSVLNSDKFGIGTYIKYVRGLKVAKISEAKLKHPSYGSGKSQSEAWWQAIARVLIQEKFLLERTIKTGQRFSYVAISKTPRAESMIRNNDTLKIKPPSTILNLLKSKPQKSVAQGWILTAPGNATASTSKKITQETESQEQIEERMALYHKLLEQRGEIASQLDCMPYMVASNAALMTMSKVKPQTLDNLRQLNLDGFAEAKINKFGDKFLKIITGKSERVDDKKRSIKEILDAHPLDDNSFNLSCQVSCSMLQAGLTAGEIATKRGVSFGTIASHLISGIKCGYSIKMIELGVNEECRDAVIRVYRRFCKNGFQTVKLATMKDQCPAELTYDQIKTVLAYLQVRTHLQNLNIPYKEFEDFDFGEVEAGVALDKFKVELGGVNRDQSDSEDTPDELETTPQKKIKVEESDFDSILDSPPRPDATVAPKRLDFQSPVRKELFKPASPRTGKSLKSRKKVLPPWLVVKKIH